MDPHKDDFDNVAFLSNCIPISVKGGQLGYVSRACKRTQTLQRRDIYQARSWYLCRTISTKVQGMNCNEHFFKHTHLYMYI